MENYENNNRHAFIFCARSVKAISTMIILFKRLKLLCFPKLIVFFISHIKFILEKYRINLRVFR